MDDIVDILMSEIESVCRDMRHDNFSKNINVTIPYIKDLVDKFLSQHKKDIDFNLTNLLTPKRYDMAWIIAQGESIIQCV